MKNSLHFTVFLVSIVSFDAVNRLIRMLEERSYYGPVYNILLVCMVLTLALSVNSILTIWQRVKIR